MDSLRQPRVCEVCGEVFPGRIALIFHKWSEHREVNANAAQNLCNVASTSAQPSPVRSRRRHTCDVCSAQFSGGIALMKHRRVAHPRRKTAHQAVTTETRDLYPVVRVVQPDTADVVSGESMAPGHSSADERLRTEPTSSTLCALCGLIFPCVRNLARHMRQQHGSPRRRQHVCKECNLIFAHKRSLDRHVAHKHSSRPAIRCDQCKGVFSRVENLAEHRLQRRCGGRRSIIAQRFKMCPVCGIRMKSLRELYTHRRVAHPSLNQHMCHGCCRRFKTRCARAYHELCCRDLVCKRVLFRPTVTKSVNKFVNPQMNDDVQPMDASRAGGQIDNNDIVEHVESDIFLEGDARIHRLHITSTNDLQLTLIHCEGQVKKLLQDDLECLRQMKWYMVAHVRVSTGQEQGGDSDMRYLRNTPVIMTLRADEISGHTQTAIMGVLDAFDKCVDGGSQITFEEVILLELRVAKYSPLAGSSYIPLPQWLDHPRKGLINIRNFGDDKCFAYSVLAGIKLPSGHAQRVSNYLNRLGELDMSGLSYPIQLKDIERFEVQNPEISITVLGLEEDKYFVPLRVRKQAHRRHHVNLLYLRDGEDSHYVLIKDMSALLSKERKVNKRLYWCDNCLRPQKTAKALETHRVVCVKNDAQVVVLPEGDSAVSYFRDQRKQMLSDYCIYADFETINCNISTCLPNPENSHTTKTSKLIPSGFSYIIVDDKGKLLKPPVVHHGEKDVAKSFLQMIDVEVRNIQKLRGPSFPLHMSPKQQQVFEKSTNCYLCKKPLPRPGIKKVRDHDHSVQFNNYRGAACHTCNLNLQRPSHVPVFFHNLSNFDGHLIWEAIGEFTDGSDISCIPKTKEKYMCFTWGKIRFLDSFNFLPASLETLVATLSVSDFGILEQVFPDSSHRDLLLRKNVYPYDYFDDFEKFNDVSLPARSAFFNSLTGESVSDVDFDHALNVFKTFEMKNLWDLHDTYVLGDVCQLACVFESFRKMSMDDFKLDPAHFVSTPHLAWSAVLLTTGVKLDLLTDIDQVQMVEGAIRGGVATINERFAEANNPYVPETYDPEKPHDFIAYLDANALYATSLSRPLPTGNFRWMSEAEIQNLNINSIQIDDPQGMILEVSLDYSSQECHVEHNDFPLCPEHMVPSNNLLSPLQLKMQSDYNLPENKCKKLIPNLFNKEKISLYCTTLKLYVSLGMKISKIHRGIIFDQSRWMKPYIDFNTEKRQQATTGFGKMYRKLLGNAPYGKAVESVRKRKNVTFTKLRSKFRKLVSQPTFHSFETFDFGLVAVERKKARVVLDRPIYVGMVVLDTAKEHMYDFHYNVMKKRYKGNISVLGSDTDSFFYKIRTHDLYEDMYAMREYFDLSDYPVNSKFHCADNRKVLGRFKDESCGVALRSFCGLRAKMCTFTDACGGSKMVGKGIPRAALKSQVRASDYLKCIKSFSRTSVSFKKITTDQRHHLYTVHSVKRGLSCYDDKRYILPDNVKTLAFGHFSIS